MASGDAVWASYRPCCSPTLATMSVFVSPEVLHERIQTGKNHTILAALWEPAAGKAWSKYQSEHIPTALFCDPASQLVGMPSSTRGRNPIPPIEALNRAVESWGVQPGRPIYVYDSGNCLFAARAWWVLRWAGIEDVYILDGGFARWDGDGFPTVAGPGGVVVPHAVQITAGSLPTADLDEVRGFEGLLLDARSKNRFDGRREVLDLRAGHIPGAINLPVAELFDEAGTCDAVVVKDADRIRARCAQVGVTDQTDPSAAIAYSGSGNHSALLLAAMEHAGLPVLTHYVGGWSQWSANRDNPVATNL